MLVNSTQTSNLTRFEKTQGSGKEATYACMACTASSGPGELSEVRAAGHACRRVLLVLY